MAGYWPLSFFYMFMDLVSVSSHKLLLAKKDFANIQPSWPCGWSVTHIYLLCICFRILYNLLNIGTEQYIHQSLYADRSHGSAGKQPSFNPVANLCKANFKATRWAKSPAWAKVLVSKGHKETVGLHPWSEDSHIKRTGVLGRGLKVRLLPLWVFSLKRPTQEVVRLLKGIELKNVTVS